MSTVQRITGTNSGLDVDALVKSSMATYQSKIDKETQNKKVLEYQQEQYKQIMTDATTFNDKYFDILKTGNLVSTSTYQSMSFTSGDSAKVTAKGFAGADASDYKVTTTQIASKATHTVKGSDLASVATSGEGVMAVKMGNDNIYVDIAFDKDKNVDMATTAKNLNTALTNKGIDVTAKYSEFSQGIVLESGKMGESVNFQVGIQKGITAEEAADGTSFTSDYSTYSGQNAKGVITKGTETSSFNQASNTLTVDNVQFSFKAPSTVTTATNLTALTLTNTGVTVSSDGKTITSADGNTATVTSDDGTITTTKVDATTGVLTKTVTNGTTTTTNSYASVSLSGATDVTGLKDKIVSFVNDYNTLLGSINTKIYETRDKDYMPLTDAQKEKMTDTQIAAWEKKAQTGLLRKDNDLERITSAMKSAMSSVMSGSGLSLENIGINPVADYADKNGLFTIDEGKLTKALEDNAGNVKDLFTRATSTTDKGGVFTQLAATLKSEFKTVTSSLSKEAGLGGTSTQYNNTLTTGISKKKQLIYDLNKSFSTKETALYNKYSALETAMQKLNSQQSSLSSMLGTA